MENRGKPILLLQRLWMSIRFFGRFPKGLASLSACQSLCENTMGCKGVEYHISGRCEIWTRPGGIEASIGAPQWVLAQADCFRHSEMIA